METREQMILQACKDHKETDPVAIFDAVAKLDFVRMHGPEHHILDGACILTAYKNAGGTVDLEQGLNWIVEQGSKMPGAACAHWGVCGSTMSVASALAFIDQTSPLSVDGTWGKHMLYTARVLERMGTINGPRCCKRDAYLSFEAAIDYIAESYGVKLEKRAIQCSFLTKNQQCIKERCPYNKTMR